MQIKSTILYKKKMIKMYTHELITGAAQESENLFQYVIKYYNVGLRL